MKWLVNRILYFMINQKVIDNDEDTLNFYKYGIEITISSLTSIIIISLLGLVTNNFLNSTIFLISFILIRSFVGGYHADTYVKCNLLMCISFICVCIVNVLLRNISSITLGIPCCLISLIIVSIFGPVENVNKPITQKRKKKLKIIGIIIYIIMSVVCNIMVYNNIEIGTLLILILVLISILIIAAKIKERRKSNEKVS